MTQQEYKTICKLIDSSINELLVKGEETCEYVKYTYAVNNCPIFETDDSGAPLQVCDNDRRTDALNPFIDLINLKGEKCAKCGGQLSWGCSSISGNTAVFCSNDKCKYNFDYMKEKAKYGKTLTMALNYFSKLQENDNG